jgi:NAD(P)H-dependent FMN reductase
LCGDASSLLVNLLFFSGSSQVGSVNARLAGAAADLVRRRFDAEVTAIDLSDFDLPNYGQAAQSGALPADAVKLRGLLRSADGVFLSSDEYTGTYSAVFRNAVGWLTDERDGSASVLRGKPVALCGASAGGVGALRGQPALNQLLREIGAEVISQHLELGTSPSPFDPQGQLLPRVERQLVDACLRELLEAARQRQREPQPR